MYKCLISSKCGDKFEVSNCCILACDIVIFSMYTHCAMCTGRSKKTDTQFYFWDNFGNSAPILTILSLLQAEIYGA